MLSELMMKQLNELTELTTPKMSLVEAICYQNEIVEREVNFESSLMDLNRLNTINNTLNSNMCDMDAVFNYVNQYGTDAVAKKLHPEIAGIEDFSQFIDKIKMYLKNLWAFIVKMYMKWSIIIARILVLIFNNKNYNANVWKQYNNYYDAWANAQYAKNRKEYEDAHPRMIKDPNGVKSVFKRINGRLQNRLNINEVLDLGQKVLAAMNSHNLDEGIIQELDKKKEEYNTEYQNCIKAFSDIKQVPAYPSLIPVMKEMADLLYATMTNVSNMEKDCNQIKSLSDKIAKKAEEVAKNPLNEQKLNSNTPESSSHAVIIAQKNNSVMNAKAATALQKCYGDIIRTVSAAYKFCVKSMRELSVAQKHMIDVAEAAARGTAA